MGTKSAVSRQTAELLQRLIDGSLAGTSEDSAAVEAAGRRVLVYVPAESCSSSLKHMQYAFVVKPCVCLSSST